ncbi:hypothetical protein GCM10023322_81840 [Rugosimonospora acidiphila]|uniref:GerMN domain-containing protein n=1 Tax=Rugosimonospora acidiphila TaxID=556531 RepID=A0ABP9ST63_9ACTN
MSGAAVRRTLVVVAALAVSLLAGCGVRPSGVITGGPAPQAPGEKVQLYLLSHAMLTPVVRPLTAVPTPTQALEQLAAGPDGDELAQGYTTEVPRDVAPVVVTIRSSSVTVKLSSDPAGLSAAAVGQIVCTVGEVVVTAGQQARPAVTLIGQGHSRGPLACPLPQ